MNISKEIARVKRELGITAFRLPFENPDKELYEIAKDTTLETWSQYYGKMEEYTIDVKDADIDWNTFNEAQFRIPSMLIQDREIIDVLDIEPVYDTYNGAYMPGVGIFNNGVGMYQDMMLGQIEYDLESSVSPIFSWDFIRPNKIRMYNFFNRTQQIRIKLMFDHMDDLASIPKTHAEAFRTLLKLDIQVFLYNNLKHMDKIETAYGTVDLHIEEWASAENDRRDFVNRMAEDSHLGDDNPGFYYA